MLHQLLHRAGKVSIALILSVALTAVVTLVLTAFAIYFYQAERAQRWEQLHKTLANSADELAAAVALPAWNFDETQIVTIMKSGLSNRELYASVVQPSSSNHPYVLLRSADGPLVAAASLPSGAGLLMERRAIVAAGQHIGTISVYASPAVLLEQMRQRRMVIGGMILLMDVTLVLSLYLLLWQLMLKPLTAVGRYAAYVKQGQNSNAPPPRAWFFGELKTLNASIRDMVTLLDSRYVAMHASEERLQIASSAAAIGIWDWNVISGEMVWDEQMYRLYDAEDSPGRRRVPPLQLWQDMLHPDDAIPTRALLQQALEGRAEYDVEFRVIWPDGSVRHIKADAMTFRDADSRPVRMVGVNYDITAQKTAELELRRHRHHLEELVEDRTRALSVAVLQAQAANQAKSTFLANMSHELRTPLNSVIGFSRLMADSKHMLPEEKRNLAIIHRSGHHLLTLINDILELSKIEAGRAVLQTEVVNLAEMLQEVMDMVSMRAGQGGIELVLDCAGMPAAARVDGTKLRQVLLNLLSNAVKFAHAGRVTLHVRGHAGADGRCELACAVIDTGPGIAPADQARIFEPFIQADGPGAKEGTGLGLTISREFVLLMGGTLSVQSSPGAGATFSFSIPVQVAAGALAPAGADSVAALAPEQRGRRILVADDNEDGCALLVSLLEPLGFELRCVADGSAALAAIAAWAPELVFMDWRMPVLDGLAATRAARADAALVQPRIVMLTASAFAEERSEALEAGADDFMRKPVQQEQLYRVLEQQLGLQFVRRQHSAPLAAPAPLAPADLAALAPELRLQLQRALQELNLARVAALLAPLPPALAGLVARIEHMVQLHQYPQLCTLLEEDGGAVASPH